MIVALSASQSRAADSTSVCSTVCRSKVERLMTLSTSAVAVCCCRIRRSSLSRRAFSIAMTAWRGEAREQLDLLVGERAHLLAVNDNGADQLVFLEHGDDDVRPRPGEIDKRNDAGITVEIASSCRRSAMWSDLFGLGEAIERSARLIAHDDCWFPPEPVGVAGRAVYRHRAKVVSLSQEQIAELWLRICRVAFSSIALNTGSSSPGELEMTWRTSEVAVCCSKASESSRVRACTSSNSRTFSIAITAWSAKVVTSSICLSVKRPHGFALHDDDADRSSFAQKRDTEQGTETAELLAPKICVFRISKNVGDVNYLAFHQRSPDSRTPIDTGRVRGQECFVFARVPEHRLIAIDGTLRSGQCRHIRLAQVGGGLDQRVEYGLEIEGRAADDLEHVGGGGLLLQQIRAAR